MNDGIPRELSTVYHAIVNDAVSLIKKSGRGSALAKTDIRSAFRIIPFRLSADRVSAGAIIEDGDRKSWDPLGPMTWDNFFYFQNKLRHPDVIYQH